MCAIVVALMMGVVSLRQLDESSVVYNAVKLAPEQVDVIWPQAEVVLQDQQTFVVAIRDSLYGDVYAVDWTVRDSEFAGTLAALGGRHEGLVDVSLWNWRKDHSYTVDFTISDTRSGAVVATSSRVVYTDRVDIPAFVVEEAVPDVIATAPMVRAQAPRVLGESTTKTFKTTRKESRPSESQQFTIALDGFDESKISVFWASQDGHRNQILTRDSQGNFTTAINFFGWRWQGDGPYGFSFGVIDNATQAVVASVPYELRWQGEAITLQAGAVTIADTAPTALAAASSPAPATSAPAPAPTPSTPVASTPTRTEPTTPINTARTPTPPTPATNGTPPAKRAINQVWASQSLYIPNKPAVTSSFSRVTPEVRTSLEAILAQPSSVWLNGDAYEADGFVAGIFTDAEAKQQVPVFVLYNIPYRDCGSYSSGGAAIAANYRSWVDGLATQFANRPFIAIIEPDALSMLNCLAPEQRTERLELIAHAAKTLGALPGGSVYIDAGHPFWVSAEEMSQRLRQAGIAHTRGFALNVSNFVATEYNHVYGNFLSSLTDGARYVVDTSRNGRGNHPDYQWCNPDGRGLGPTPRLIANDTPLDGYLWIKFPGESDGTCNGGPNAGGWWPEYAHGLYQNRVR